jgi:1-deoxy-D-xylulose-5-phosphate reductoisomerase
MIQGATAPLVFNAANEIAVDSFLRNRIGFLDISHIIENTLNKSDLISTTSIDDLLALDASTRECAEIQVDQLG